ncbi:MAG: sensor histidine kinase [Flavobacteriales bacterium]
MQELFKSELINRLYALHVVCGEDGQVQHCSEQFKSSFPNATSIFDLLAPNSAQELLTFIQNLKKSSTASGTIDLFSIQIFATWKCKVVQLDKEDRWLLCMETSAVQHPAEKNPERLSASEIQELQRKNLFYEALLQQLPAELAVFDPEFKFLFVNRHAIKNEELRNWLIGRAEIEYWKAKNLPLDKTLQRIEGFKEAVAERKSTGVEEVFHAGTPQEKHYVRITHPYFEKDELQFLLSYGIDITTLKQTEHKLIQQNAELEKVNAELDQFVYSASHNLRAPLLSMKGLLSLVSPGKTPAAEIERYIGEANKSIERLDATIRDIIEYSKNARLPLNPHPVNLSDLIHHITEDLRFYENSRLAIRQNIPTDPTFYSDASRLKSILHNIISNAVKYADASKGNSWLNIDVTIDETRCTLLFTDNGLGIQPEHTARVFDMFYRGTSAQPGSGLGLYIVKEMTEKLGGTIQLNSTPGVGTEIHIKLRNFT